ncbi:MAG: transglycosylase SLT domain-containing protein [Pseudomonadota bacterium]
MSDGAGAAETGAVSKAASKTVYGPRSGRWQAWLLLGVCALALAGVERPAWAQTGEQTILEAREAFRKRDRSRLAAARAAALAAKHPLAGWVDYWDHNSRMAELRTSEVEEFYVRWKDTYVEDRFRNDWLLELGRRRDWAAFAADFPRFRMNDDREVTCYDLLTQQQKGADVRDAALAAWLAQPDADTGCLTMATALFEARQLTEADVWRKARFAIDANRPRAAQQAVGLLGEVEAKALKELLDSPARHLARRTGVFNRLQAELSTLALMRMAVNDPGTAAGLLNDTWERKLPQDLAAWAWAMVGKQSAVNLLPEAHEHFQRAAKLMVASEKADKGAAVIKVLDFPDDTLAWKARAGLRAPRGPQWSQVLQAVGGMTAAQQRDTTWVYWKARALKGLAEGRPEADTDAIRGQSRDLLDGISGQYNFYGALASEDLGRPVPIPAKPAPLTAEERAATVRHPGLSRALSLIGMGLRGEGDREWNFSLRGMNDRQLLAAAQWACDMEVWKTCINTSDRTKSEVDLTQRFPMPFRREVLLQSSEIGLDPAYVYGLIRQESRFIMDARSSVGASGLMQLMPATARWTARRIGLAYTPELITDRDTNIKLGTNYLKLVLDDLGGSQAMAAAAYNAGPGRPRRWREGTTLEVAAWAETIPFNETRDYVKKVLSNATYYAALLGNEKPSLKARMGNTIGPREPQVAAPDRELP